MSAQNNSEKMKNQKYYKQNKTLPKKSEKIKKSVDEIKRFRLQKFIAQSGFCSRRKAEELIKAGKVKVNGKTVTTFLNISGKEYVEIAGERIKAKEKIYIKFFKPRGFVCTRRKFKGEKSVFDLLPKHLKDLKIGGRLDKDSEGLLILSSDGDFIFRTTHPSFQSSKEYEVSFLQDIKDKDIKKWSQGVEIDKEKFLPCQIQKRNKKEIKIILKEGKKRQIRRIAAFFGLDIKNLRRTRILDITLEDMKEGEFRKSFTAKSKQ